MPETTYPLPKKKPLGVSEKRAKARAEAPQPRVGRKTLLTPEMTATITDLLRRGNYLSTVAKAVGLNPSTLQVWLKRGNDLIAEDREYDDYEQQFVDYALEVEKARARAEINAVEVIRSASTTQWQAAAWYLERTNNSQWGRTVRTEVTGAEGGPIQVDADSVMRKLEALQQRYVEADVVQDAELEA